MNRFILVFGCLFAMFAFRSLAADEAKPKADEAGEKAAREAAESWLKLIDDGKYEESWKDAAELFQKAVTKQQWADAAKAARDPLGKLLSRKFKSAESKTTLPGAPDGHYVILQFDSSFENKKEAVETVTPMQDKEGKWHVSGYFVR